MLNRIIEKKGEDYEFYLFIYNILRYKCLLKEETVSKYFGDEKAIKLLRQAFTHESYSREDHYQYLEFRGDPVVNLAAVDYLAEKYPHIKNQGLATKIKHYIVSDSFLAKVAMENGFCKEGFIRYKDDEEYYKKCKATTKEEYLEKIVEDVVEAFCGAVCELLNDETAIGSVGYRACYNFISDSYDQMYIPTTLEEVTDGKTKFKEFLDCRFKNDPQYNINNLLKTYDFDDHSLEIYKRYAYPKPKGEIINANGNHITFGYDINGGKKRIITAAVSRKILEGEKEVGEKMFKWFKEHFPSNISVD